MKVRQATLDDAVTIAHLHTISWLTAFSKFAPDLAQKRADQLPERLTLWGEILHDDETFTLIASDDHNNIIGFGQGGKIRDDIDVIYEAELIRLYVSPNHAGQGVGKCLIHHVAQRLLEQGYHSMIVAAWSINTPARSIYEHLGGQFVTEIKQKKLGFDASQTIYAWDDIQTLIEATQ